MTLRRLEGKVALITGSDSGIGQATAIRFAEEGADVVVHYLHDADGAERTRAGVEAAGRRGVVIQADVQEEDQVERMFDAAVAQLGTLDILMNNAGVDASGTPVAELSTEVWDRAIRTNLYGYFFCARRFARLRLAAGGGGKLVNVSSVHADNPNAGGSDYDCSKGAVPMLTPFNHPAIDDPALRAEQLQSITWRRAARPEEIAKLAVFLASADADYVTGASYVIDGGLIINLGQGA